MPGVFFCFLLKLQNENAKFHLFRFRRHWSRVTGTGPKRCQLCRPMPVFDQSAQLCPLGCYLIFIALNLKNPTGLKSPYWGKPEALAPRSTLKRKYVKKNIITMFTISIERGMDFTLKLSLLCDLPIVLDFLMNDDSEVKEAFFSLLFTV